MRTIDGTPKAALARKLNTETVHIPEGWFALHQPKGPDMAHSGDCVCRRKASIAHDDHFTQDTTEQDWI